VIAAAKKRFSLAMFGWAKREVAAVCSRKTGARRLD
jgi:hypothetical protein